MNDDERTTLAAPATARARAAGLERRPDGRREISVPVRPSARPGSLDLTAKAIKVTLVVDPAALAGFAVPNGGDRVRFRLTVGARQLRGELDPKTLRKVIATIAEHGAEAVAVILQGKLGAGDVMEEAGIIAQVKGQ